MIHSRRPGAGRGRRVAREILSNPTAPASAGATDILA
jgi:hypothetical protein